MFKEIVENIIKVAQPVVEMPSFVGDSNRPLDLVTLLIAIFNTSNDTDRYVKTIESEDGDFIYVLYRDLIKDHKQVVMYDNLLYRGKIRHITIIDYNIAVADGSIDNALTLLMILSVNAVTFLKAKNANMFYHKPKRLVFIFDQAPLIVFINTALSIFSCNDSLKSAMVELINHTFKDQEGFSNMTLELLDAHIRLIDNNGIESLLDSSLIAAVVDSNTDSDSKNETETV